MFLSEVRQSQMCRPISGLHSPFRRKKPRSAHKILHQIDAYSQAQYISGH